MIDFLTPLYQMGDPASSTVVPPLRRRHSFSTSGTPDKVSLEIKDDIFVANLMATLNPEPWEIKKRLKSQIPVNHLRRKARDQQQQHSDLNNESHQLERDYARNNQVDGVINSRASNGQGNQLDPSQSSGGDP